MPNDPSFIAILVAGAVAVAAVAGALAASLFFLTTSDEREDRAG